MTDEDGKVKESGASKAGLIAVVTALIGGITTISVAYINKADPAPPKEKSQVEERRDSSGNAGSLEPELPPTDSRVSPPPSPPPPPLQHRNVAGLWLSGEGERMEIAQQGRQITVNASGESEIGLIVAQGNGQIAGRELTWTAQSNINGQMVEMDCSARLTTAGNSIQGNCNVLGQPIPFIYSR